MAGGKKGDKALHFGARLKYPIKITKLYKTPGDTIKRQEPVLQYSFEYTMELPQDRETLELRTKTLTSITDWDAPEDGKLLAWNVRVGDVVARDCACATVEEACTHEVQFQGLCALCGRDMNEVNWASEQRDTDRAPINMTHDQTSLTVSRGAATRAENELQQRLLAQRKLSLVVDLDQTIIHACIDPTIGEWQQDPSNPNYRALRDVQRFQLEEGHHGVARGCYYYIKMRPGLADFLATIATMYELHVYTMGTRTYATNIARIVDPDQRLFGNRVISRDENGNIVSKSLQRLFPVSTHMAVIMDDRADVWPYNRHNLIKVTPYDFFKGTGDINSSFLPKRADLPAAASPTTPTSSSSPSSSSSSPPPSAAVDGDSPESAGTAASEAAPPVATDNNEAAASPASTAASTAMSTGASEATASTASTTSSSESTAATSVPSLPSPTSARNGERVPPANANANANANGAADDAPVDQNIDMVLLQKQTEEQERTIESQIMDRPLLHMQEELDRADEEAAAAAAAATAATAAAATEADAADQDASHETETRPRHCVLSDDDSELRYLQEHLTKLHHAYYDEYDAKLNTPSSRDKAASDGSGSGGKGAAAASTAAVVPDVGEVLDRFKAEVLAGTTIVLSGLVPLGVDVERTEIGLQAISFGANLQRQISRKVTHLVISSDRPRTQKVRQAAKIPTTKIVNQNWLMDCFSRWAHVDETPYLIDVHPADRGQHAASGSQLDATDTETVSDIGSDDEDGEHGEYGEDEFKEFNNSDAVSPIAELGTFDWGSADDELAMFLAEGDDEDDEDDDEDDEEREGTDYGDNDDVDMDQENRENGGTGDGDDLNGSSLLSTASKRKHRSGGASGSGSGGGDTDTESDRASIRGRSLLVKRQKFSAGGASRSRSASRLRVTTSAAAGAAAGGLGIPGVSDGSHPLRQQTSSGDIKIAPAAPAAAAAVAVGGPPAPGTGNIDIDEDELEAMLMAELDEEEAAAEGNEG